MPLVSRWFVRCHDCLSIAAIAEQPNPHVMRCGLCDGPIETMGRVQQDRLVRDEYRTACDDRCTSARGPLCVCKCGGQNHGTHRTVHVIRDCGPVPKVAMPSDWKAKRTAEEWRTARAYVLSILDRLLERRRAGYLPSADYQRMRELQTANRKAHDARTHAGRMAIYRAAAGELPTPPEPEPPPTIAPAHDAPSSEPRPPFNARAARQAALFA